MGAYLASSGGLVASYRQTSFLPALEVFLRRLFPGENIDEHIDALTINCERRLFLLNRVKIFIPVFW
jgi:hypothetical protein